MTLLVNYYLDLTTQLTAINRLSVQARFVWGTWAGRNGPPRWISCTGGLGILRPGEVERAVSYWTEALDLDPSFDPPGTPLGRAGGPEPAPGSAEHTTSGVAAAAAEDCGPPQA
jgi:hypothetical protein